MTDSAAALTKVPAFLGSLVDAVAKDDPAALGWLAGPPGRRLVVALGAVMTLHPLEQPTGCLECKSLRRPCLTCDVYCRALAGSDDARIGMDFRLLARRYGGDRMPDRG
jgi:hypothetical protein